MGYPIRLNLRIDAETKQMLTELAAQEERSICQTLRRLVRAEYERRKEGKK